MRNCLQLSPRRQARQDECSGSVRTSLSFSSSLLSVQLRKWKEKNWKEVNRLWPCSFPLLPLEVISGLILLRSFLVRSIRGILMAPSNFSFVMPPMPPEVVTLPALVVKAVLAAAIYTLARLPMTSSPRRFLSRFFVFSSIFSVVIFTRIIADQMLVIYNQGMSPLCLEMGRARLKWKSTRVRVSLHSPRPTAFNDVL